MNEQEPLLPGSPPRSHSHAVSRALYLSHFLSTWNARVLEYGAVLFLAELAPGTFLPLSLYAQLRSLSAVLLSNKIGSYIDSTNRLKVVRNSIVYQRLAVMATCGLFWVMAGLHKDEEGGSKQPQRMGEGFSLTLGALIALACVERLCATMNLVSVERDWVVVIADGDNELLRSLNARMRRIDLFCKLVGPLAISYLDAWFSLVDVVALLLVWNLISMFVEYHTILQVYNFYPLLHEPKEAPPSHASEATRHPIKWLYHNVLKGFVFYVKHALFLPSFALSLLYMTVLSFGPQMVAFLLFQGRSPIEVGLMRTVSVIVELATTFIAPPIMGKAGPTRSGLGFVYWQALALGVAVYFSYPLLSSTARVSTGALYLVVGVILSRIGLWGFDLCVQIIIQAGVEPANRAVFSSVEAAFQSLFEMLSFLQTIVWASPHQFKYPVLISTGTTVVAAALFTVHACRSRKLVEATV